MKIVISNLLKFFFVAALVFIFFSGCQQTQDNEENPWEYDLTALKKVDPNLLTYNELEPILLPFDELNALAIDDKNNLYVAADSVIRKYDQNKLKVLEFSLDEEVKAIANVSNKLYVGLVDRIEVWSTAGKKLQSWEPLNRRAIITSIVVTKESVFIADAGNKQVMQFEPDGKFVSAITADRPGFIVPSPYFDLAKDSNDDVWVVNPGKHQIVRINKDGSLSNVWGKTAWTIDGFSGCCNPTHITILPDGKFITSEKGLPRVKVYTPEGKLVAVAAEPQKFHEEVTGLDLATDKEGRIYVLDPLKKQVRVFISKVN